MRENGRTLPLTRRIEGPGATIPRTRWSAPPEFRQRDRPQPQRIRLREQLRRRAVAGTSRWLFRREQLAQRAHLAQGVRKAVRVLNGRQQFARAGRSRLVVGTEVVQLGLTGNPDGVARGHIVGRGRPALNGPQPRHHAGEGPQIAHRAIRSLHHQYPDHFPLAGLIEPPRGQYGPLEGIHGVQRRAPGKRMHRGAIKRARKSLRKVARVGGR